ncbi:MAG: NitT/TauT family transport system ATP-binding protein [Alphaproteobacteria bacterium]|jgi:NitT/TauT family transport system ATP-binding protein|nr:NitT/TauT family transport system ATP-binding protein [Alphaproteobacteria bacterium]
MISICVKNLNKCYRVREGNLPALSAVDLEVAEGEFVSIVGPSGCGKSTLLYILGGFIRADSGVIEVGGKAVTGPGTDRGVVFQEYALFPWLTVTQNIRYGLEMTGVARREREETVRRLVRTIGLEGFEHRFPRELSGGMKQRVAIARTLAYDPNILLLDEPFGALDAQTRETMQDELLRLWQATRKTVVMVTHDVNEAVYLSDRVLVMSQRPGRMVAEFTIAIDRSGNRETTMLNADFNAVRNEVWLAVRRQVAATIAA